MFGIRDIYNEVVDMTNIYVHVDDYVYVYTQQVSTILSSSSHDLVQFNTYTKIMFHIT